MRTAARADRVVGGEICRPDRSCATRSGEGQGNGRPRGRSHVQPVGEICSEPDGRGLTAHELIRLAQAVRLRPGRD